MDNNNNNKRKNDIDTFDRIANDVGYGAAIDLVPRYLLDDRAFILDIVREEGCLLEYASPRLQDDYDVVLAALMNDSEALEFASERLQKELKK